MSVELAALVFAVLGPIASGYAIYLTRRNSGYVTRRLDNDMPHLIARLDQLEQRVGRLEDRIIRDRHDG